MAVKNSPDWLPAGFDVEVKVRMSGQKDKYYIHLKSGKKFRSKGEVLRYHKMGRLHNHTPRPIKRRINLCSRDKLVLLVKMEDTPECLPTGWTTEIKTRKSGKTVGTTYKCYIAPLTGYKCYSKREVARYLKTGEMNSCTSTPKKRGVDMHSTTDVVVVRTEDIVDGLPPGWTKEIKARKTGDKIREDPVPTTMTPEKRGVDMHSTTNVVVQMEYIVDGLPLGWTKEIKIRKTGDKIRKDPYYIDPVTGHIFRSKLDVLRYLDTGEAGKHVFKPKKRSISDMESVDAISLPTAAKRQKLAGNTTRRRLFTGQSSNANETVKDERILESSVTEESIPYSTHAVDQCRNVGGECTDLSKSDMPKSEGSKKRQGKQVSTGNRLVSAAPGTGVPPEKQMLENGVEKCGNRKTQLGSSKSKDKKELVIPRRTSKRLAALKAEPSPDLVTRDCTHQVDIGQSSPLEAIPVSVWHSQLKVDMEVDPTPRAYKGCTEVPSGEKPLNKVGHPLGMEEQSNECGNPLEDQAALEEHTRELETNKKNDEKPESPLILPFGDSWPDPCLEFAFKTLTGAIPVEDNLAIQDYFQQQLSSVRSHSSSGMALPDFGIIDNFGETDEIFQFNTMKKSTSTAQLQEKPAFSKPGNDGMANLSKNVLQPPCGEGKKEWQRR